MKISVALITLLAFASAAVLSGTVECATQLTYVDNLSGSWTLVATTFYRFSGNSQFINRYITPFTWQNDQYSEADCCFTDCVQRVGIQLRLQYESCTYTVYVDCDRSVVGLDNSNGLGVDIYVSTYGDIETPDPDYAVLTTVWADSYSGGC